MKIRFRTIAIANITWYSAWVSYLAIARGIAGRDFIFSATVLGFIVLVSVYFYIAVERRNPK